MYEIRRVQRFTDQLNPLLANFNRLGEAVEMMEIVLSRAPEGRGFVVGVDDVRYIRTKPFPGVPQLIIFFRIAEDEKCVYLMQAEQCDREAEE